MYRSKPILSSGYHQGVIDGKTFSIFLPEETQEVRSNAALVTYVASRENTPIRLISVGIFPKVPESSGTSFDCKALDKEVLFTTLITAFGERVDSCENPLGISVPEEFGNEGYVLYGTSGFGEHPEQGNLYIIQVVAYKAFAESTDGKKELQRIFESFQLKNS